jgi:hypothetical protein
MAFPDESLAAIVLNKTNNIKRCSVAAYKINMLLARLFPMIPLVRANTARSSGFRAWIALCASWPCQLLPFLKSLIELTLPLKASNGFMCSSYLSLYRPISSSRRPMAPLSRPAPLVPLGPGIAVSRYDCVYRTFSYSLRLSDWRDLISARRSEIDSNCLRSSYIVSSILCSRVAYLLQLSVTLPESISLRGDDWQD